MSTCVYQDAFASTRHLVLMSLKVPATVITLVGNTAQRVRVTKITVGSKLTRVSSNGKIRGFQPFDRSSILLTRSKVL